MSRRSRYQPQIDAALAAAPGPLSAAELHAVLTDPGADSHLDDGRAVESTDKAGGAVGAAGVGIATVYRVLAEGADTGRYAVVQIPGGPARYEPADRPHHHHFECVACERVYDVAGCPGGMQRLVPERFTLESHDVLLRGRCARCGEGSAS